MVDAGEFRERIEVLKLEQDAAGSRWAADRTVWAKAEQQDKNNLFSTVGIGARSVLFTLRRQPLTLHNAFRWKERHCFLTAIKEIDRMYLEVRAALVEPVPCTAFRMVETAGADKAPARTLERLVEFPAILTEKYLGFVQNVPMAQTETTYVLVTPKRIELREADLVDVAGGRYAVRVCHTLDEYKNEYEIHRKKDL